MDAKHSRFKDLGASALVPVLALVLSGCGAGMTWMPERPARLMGQVRSAAVLPFPGGGPESDDFYEAVASELWPGRVAARAAVAEALRAEGLQPPGSAITKTQALAIASRLGADTVLSADIDGEGVLRLRVTDSPSGTQWRKNRHVSSKEDMVFFVREIREGFTARARATSRPYQAPQKKRARPAGAPIEASGSTAAPAAGPEAIAQQDGVTQEPAPAEPLEGGTIKDPGSSNAAVGK